MDFYDLEFKDSAGRVNKMSAYRGKLLLIVNTATKCGFAPQFRNLEFLYQKYKDKGFEIIGFPCNQFLNQEPESNETMTQTCKLNYGVTFLLSEKINVNGRNTHPVFAYLKKNTPSGGRGRRIKWNFSKFLVSQGGGPLKRYAPTFKPLDIEEDIARQLSIFS